jgi:UDP-N-acetylmuramate dehydrogenase
MHILEHVSLRNHSTMRLGGEAAYTADIASLEDLQEALAWATQKDVPVMMIGGGSNIVWRDEGFPGLLLINKISGYESQEDGGDTLVTIGAGENWDTIVARTVAESLTGIEALSLIPGTTGATPVQNVGAYGQEIADTLVRVTVYDVENMQVLDIPTAECGFGYRTSRFKTTDKGRFYILGITLRLRRASPVPPFYQALQSYFDQQTIAEFTPQVVRDAVIAIRQSKLPDPAIVANNGSFFANPIITKDVFAKVQAQYPTVPNWPMPEERIKIPAAWLLDQTGFKDFHDPETGMGTWPAQPLVLVNEHAESTAQLLQFRQKIINAVYEKFGITLEQEPELLPA